MKLEFLGLLVLLTAFASPAFAAQLNVPMNETSVVVVEGDPTHVIVGNPMVADITLVNGHTVVIHGRVFGNTDVRVLNDAGETLADISVSVTDNWRGGVALHMGNPTPNARAGSVNYTCNPVCVRALHPGDETVEAGDFANQSGSWQDLTQRGMALGDE